MCLTFGDDGRVTMDRPTTPTALAWRYKLLDADAADFYDLPPDATDRAGLFSAPNGLVRATVRIESTADGKYEGRAMTLTAGGRTLKLIWVR